MKTFFCKNCQIFFSPKSHGGEYKYCSRKCFFEANEAWNKGIVGKESHSYGNKWAVGLTPWNKGKKIGNHHTKQSLQNISIANTGKNSYAWKGEAVSYAGLHTWLKRQKGRPTYCINCGKTSGRLHWANISGEYKRDLDDYMSLCVSCHKNYDLGNIQIKYWEK